MMVSYVVLAAAVGGTDGLIQRRKDMTLWRVRLGVFSLCLCLSVSSSCRSSILSPSDCLLRLTAAGVSRCSCTTRPPVETERPWCALIRSPSSARQPPPAPLRSCTPPPNQTCLRVTEGVRARVCVCVCVCKWVNECLALTEWVIQQNQIQLLPTLLTADCCGHHALIKKTLPPPSRGCCFSYKGQLKILIIFVNVIFTLMVVGSSAFTSIMITNLFTQPLIFITFIHKQNYVKMNQSKVSYRWTKSNRRTEFECRQIRNRMDTLNICACEREEWRALWNYIKCIHCAKWFSWKGFSSN